MGHLPQSSSQALIGSFNHYDPLLNPKIHCPTESINPPSDGKRMHFQACGYLRDRDAISLAEQVPERKTLVSHSIPSASVVRFVHA
jgi:hypothetical protein